MVKASFLFKKTFMIYIPETFLLLMEFQCADLFGLKMYILDSKLCDPAHFLKIMSYLAQQKNLILQHMPDSKHRVIALPCK